MGGCVLHSPEGQVLQTLISVGRDVAPIVSLHCFLFCRVAPEQAAAGGGEFDLGGRGVEEHTARQGGRLQTADRHRAG